MEPFHLSFLLLLLLVFSTTTATFSPPPLFPKEALPTKSGYLPISPAASSSAIFYAFYEARQPTSPLSQSPLLIWLQGGPGCSSMLANLFELGPWLISAAAPPVLTPNPATWNRRFGLLFLDNPVGAGFSIAAAAEDIPRNQSAVADHLHASLQLFLSSDPSFRSRPLYITGESYAGKYVPAIGYRILQLNARLPNSLKINLQGVAIGNGLTHPITQVNTHAATAYFTGLINDRQRAHLEKLQSEAVKLTEDEKWSEATDARNRVLNWLQNATGLATLYDLTKKKPYQSEMVGVFLNKDEVKAALGVKKSVVWEECSDKVAKVLHEDVMKSTKFMVEFLVKKSRVLLYQGQYDLRDGVASTEAWMKEIEWSGLENFLNAERKVWMVGGAVAGYVQRWGSLSHVIVSGAGHLVPTDQGLSSQVMIEDWVLEDGLFANENSAQSFRRSYCVRNVDHKGCL